MKRILIPVCILAAVAIISAAAVLILLNGHKDTETTPESTTEATTDEISKYVSNCSLEINEIKYLERGGWKITKRQDKKKGTFLEIYTNQKNGDATEYSYEVYDTEEQARAAYEEWYRATKTERYIESEEANWFKGEMPYVDDATIHTEFYVEGNVVIIAEVSVYSEWDGSSHDYSYREKYLLDHASGLRDFVIDMIIETKC